MRIQTVSIVEKRLVGFGANEMSNVLAWHVIPVRHSYYFDTLLNINQGIFSNILAILRKNTKLETMNVKPSLTLL